jgi:hypothetical protein
VQNQNLIQATPDKTLLGQNFLIFEVKSVLLDNNFVGNGIDFTESQNIFTLARNEKLINMEGYVLTPLTTLP